MNEISLPFTGERRVGAMNSVLLLGNPVARSLSPAMQNAAFAALGIDCHYEVREVDDRSLASVVAKLRTDEHIIGANVTIPHKEAVIPLLDELDPLARKVGAVNTISRDGSRLKGWNTDVDGFRRAAAERAYQITGNVVAIIGAGGAARAVAAVLQSTAGEVWVIARDLGQARRLDEDLRSERGGTVDL